MANAELFNPAKGQAQANKSSGEVAEEGSTKKQQQSQGGRTSYGSEFLTKFRKPKLKDKICENQEFNTIPRSINNLLFSVNIDITKNKEQICVDLNNLLDIISKGGGGAGKPAKEGEVTVDEGSGSSGKGGGDPSKYFERIAKSYISQTIGTGFDLNDVAINNDEYENLKISTKSDEKYNPLLFNPKCLVLYVSNPPKEETKKKDKGKRRDEGGEVEIDKSKASGKKKLYIYAPPIFNKILTTKKNADGTDVPESVLNSIQNTASNLSKMGISPDKILQADKAYKKLIDSDEITNEDTDYHFLTIIRLLQMYGLDIKLLTQISTNKMITILRNFKIIVTASDEYFFRNLDRAPIEVDIKNIGKEYTIEQELTQQIATFSTYLYYLIEKDNRYIDYIKDMIRDINY
jgi:hypothetical protein